MLVEDRTDEFYRGATIEEPGNARHEKQIYLMRSPTKVLALGFIAILSITTPNALARTWTSADGKSTFEGELIEYDSSKGQVTVDLNGKKTTFKRESLSTADIAFLNEKDKATPKAGPPPGSKWKVIPELTDEFDGTTLNSSKWWNYNPGWNGRQPGYFSPNNVTVSDGKLHLTTRAETLPDLPTGYHTYTTAAVKGKTLVKYGYYEIRCRPMKSKASSAFWFYRDTPQEWTEIDVFETCGAGSWNNKYNMNVHVFRSPTVTRHLSNSSTWKPPFVMSDDFHVYALEWNKDVIKWWVNGAVVRTLSNTHWHQPLHLNLDSETFPKWFGLPDKETLPATFSIDYVRSWSRPEDALPDALADTVKPAH
jgi:beta-glucanase (GH16 family)